MNAPPAAIAGSFADFRLIKTRSTAQLIIEIPIEAADNALAMLGGVPQAGRERPVAVARINLPVARQEPPQAPQEPADGANAKGGPLARQAGILCQDKRFQRYVNWYRSGHERSATVEATADNVRFICAVTSRAEFDNNPDKAAAWRQLHGRYLAWLETA